MVERSLTLFFNGTFKKELHDVCYDGGNHFVMVVQAGELSHQFIIDLLASVGCNDIEVVQYRIPGKTMVDGLRVICDDFDVRSLVSHFNICENIEIYVQHPCGDGSFGESARERGNMAEEEINSDEEDEDYIGCLSSEEESDEELIEVRRALKLAKQRSIMRSKKVGDDSGCGTSFTAEDEDDTDYEPSDVDESDLSEETDLNEGEEMDDFAILSGDESGEEEITRARNRFPIYDRTAKKPAFAVSMIFAGVEEFRDAVRKHSMFEQREVRFKKNNKNQVWAVCAKDNCPWLMYGSYERNTRSFHLKTYKPNHTCGISLTNKQVKSSMIAEVFASTIKAALDIKISGLKELVRKEVGIAITSSQARRTKLRVVKELMGSEVKEYALLWDHANELRSRNPNSTIVFNVRRDFDANRVIFDRFYVCFSACKRGFLDGCRRIIGVDGCFLKCFCKGEVLSAIGRDANNQMFPIAWAVVRIENKDTWNLFFERLMEDLLIDRDDGGEGWTIVSDKQKGLVDVVNTLLPAAEHRMCARHIYANGGSKYKGSVYKQMFWMIARSTNQSDYDAASKRLYNGNKEGWTALMKIDSKHWCKCFFNIDIKCDIVSNNLYEAFNDRLVDAREKSIITMLEDIRLMVMERMYKQRDQVRKWTSRYAPRIISTLEENKKEARWCMARWNGGVEYEVQHNYDVYDVNTSKRTCACRAWDLSSIPCCHAIAAIILTGSLPEDFIDEYYSKDMFFKSYAYLMNTIHGKKFWKKTGLQGPEPLPPRKKCGRYSKVRRKEAIELVKGDKMMRHGRKMTCSNCKQQGHNRTTCKQPSTGLGQTSMQG